MQSGQLFQSHGAWYVRFYEAEARITRRLGSSKELGKRQAEEAKNDLMREVNRSTGPATTLDSFIQRSYLPHAQAELRESTSHGYLSLWHSYILDNPFAQLRVREYRTTDVQALLNQIAAIHRLSSATLGHIKHFLSGAFRYAAQAGLREGNPVTECRIPKSRKPKAETYAYSLSEIIKTLGILPLPLKAAVATASFAGLRLGELNGLEWSDYNGKDLMISRSVWRGYVNPAKTKASASYVPVIPHLKTILDAHREAAIDYSLHLSERIFPVLDHIGTRTIAKAMEAVGLTWHGWHAFRRGVASNLFELGCDDVTVQRILRHARVTVTREHYIKVRHEKMDEGMAKLSERITQMMNGGHEA